MAITKLKETEYDFASQAEAEAGTESTKPMTALRTAQAITASSAGQSTGFAATASGSVTSRRALVLNPADSKVSHAAVGIGSTVGVTTNSGHVYENGDGRFFGTSSGPSEPNVYAASVSSRTITKGSDRALTGFSTSFFPKAAKVNTDKYIVFAANSSSVPTFVTINVAGNVCTQETSATHGASAMDALIYGVCKWQNDAALGICRIGTTLTPLTATDNGSGITIASLGTTGGGVASTQAYARYVSDQKAVFGYTSSGTVLSAQVVDSAGFRGSPITLAATGNLVGLEITSSTTGVAFVESSNVISVVNFTIGATTLTLGSTETLGTANALFSITNYGGRFMSAWAGATGVFCAEVARSATGWSFGPILRTATTAASQFRTDGLAGIGNGKVAYSVGGSTAAVAIDNNLGTFVGYAASSVSDAQTVSVLPKQPFVSGLSGLTAGTRYFIDDTGTLSTSSLSGAYAGLAVNTTTLSA